jgi:hypothetical protein
MPDRFSENSKLQEKLFLPPSDWPLRPKFTKLDINVRGTCLISQVKEVAGSASLWEMFV